MPDIELTEDLFNGHEECVKNGLIKLIKLTQIDEICVENKIKEGGNCKKNVRKGFRFYSGVYKYLLEVVIIVKVGIVPSVRLSSYIETLLWLMLMQKPQVITDFILII